MAAEALTTGQSLHIPQISHTNLPTAIEAIKNLLQPRQVVADASRFQIRILLGQGELSIGQNHRDRADARTALRAQFVEVQF